MNSSSETVNVVDQAVAQKSRPAVIIEAPSDPAMDNICLGCE